MFFGGKLLVLRFFGLMNGMVLVVGVFNSFCRVVICFGCGVICRLVVIWFIILISVLWVWWVFLKNVGLIVRWFFLMVL